MIALWFIYNNYCIWNKSIQPRLYILFDELIIYFFVCVKSE